MDERLAIPHPRASLTPSGDPGGHAFAMPATGSTLLLDPKAMKRHDDARTPQARVRKPYEALFDLDD